MHWTIIANYLAANWMEDAGVLTTIVGIWLTTRRNLLCWPVVLISDVLYLIVFYRVRLYSDALLQIFFLGFTLYGWWYWLRGYSLVASWWQTRKHTANWWLWIAVDLVYIGEYLYKGLRPTAVLYALLAGLAVLGLRDWRRAAAAQSAA